MFHTEGVKVTNKFLLAKLHQYLVVPINSSSQKKARGLRLPDALKVGMGVVRELEIPKYRRFFPKIPLTYFLPNTDTKILFHILLPRLARSTPTKSYQNK